MKKTAFKTRVRETLQTELDGADVYQKAILIRQIVSEEEKSEYDDSNARKPWSDDELRVIFSTAPTRENCIRHAKAFKRGVGAIKQIYQWAVTSRKRIAEVMPDSKFHSQIKRVAKESGWIF